ncbi:MAG: phosphatase PAP2 family protein [Alphaproteobacteria bacterium]|nr:phosphatase PAP2 family protein [Alphaproteobacteria bacterium]
MKTDIIVTQWLNSFAGQSGILDSLMIILTSYGVVLLVALIAMRWWSKRDRPTVRYMAICCGMATACGLFLNQIILIFLHRIRPYDAGVTKLLIDKSHDPSFPSDHATVVFAIAFSLLLQRDRYTGFFLASGVLIGLSRIYVGTHYVSDILGGALTATAATYLVARLYKQESPLNRLLVRIL